jgi:hypothetical protein
MAHDLAALPKRCEDIDKAKHLDFEMLIAHRKRHHALVEAGFAKEGFGMAIDQFEDLFALPLNLLLESIHG